MQGIDIKIDHVGALKDIALFRVNGYVDTTTSPELQKFLTQSIDSGLVQYVIDMSAVHYVSSAGWGVFVGEIRNLRESGGDLKIVQMTPEVIEVFEMLEFNRILSHYDSLEEAIDDFDYGRGIDFHQLAAALAAAPEDHSLVRERASIAGEDQIIEQATAPMTRRHSPKARLDDADLPLNEKIKRVVIDNPHMGAWGIRKALYSPRFGYAKIGYFKLRTILGKLDLETKEKRYRYFRSR